MKLYDPIIRRVSEIEAGHEFRSYIYNEKNVWPENEDYECIFQKDTALTLGGSGSGSNLICVTTDPNFFHADETLLIGPDLRDLKGNSPFARIAVLQTEEILPDEIEPDGIPADTSDIRKTRSRVRSTEKAFRILQEMDFVKYHIYPKGYMVRVSGQSAAEQVRISRKAIAQGISFERIGNTYLKHYKQNPRVLKAKVIFITDPCLNYKELSEIAVQAEQLRNSLSVIMKGIAADCGSCSIRTICNEIEGLRELHFGRDAIRNK